MHPLNSCMVSPLHQNFYPKGSETLLLLTCGRLQTFGPPCPWQTLFPFCNCSRWAVRRLPLSTVASLGNSLENSREFALPSMDPRVRNVLCSVGSIPPPLCSKKETFNTDLVYVAIIKLPHLMKVEDNSKQKQLLLKSLPIANVPFYLLTAHAALAKDQMQLHLPRSPIGLYHQAQFLQKD